MRPPRYRPLAISLALAAMLLRALLPDGWMPSAAGSTLTICSVNTLQKDGKAPTNQERSHAPCAFAAAAPLAPPALSPFKFRTEPSAVLFKSFVANERLASAPPHRPNAARAPPAIA